ncbi:MAG: hypothetical protein ICV55_03010 [Coleofasciculus sp. C3-bin4]|nr:hypothetical protein [Coleofasciculus sp. C3-bin4]
MNMNWKVLCLIAGLTLTASLSACSNSTPDSQNQVAPGGASAPAETGTTGDAVKNDKAGDAMKNDKAGDAMKKDKAGDAMKKDKAGDAMKK